MATVDVKNVTELSRANVALRAEIDELVELTGIGDQLAEKRQAEFDAAIAELATVLKKKRAALTGAKKQLRAAQAELVTGRAEVSKARARVDRLQSEQVRLVGQKGGCSGRVNKLVALIEDLERAEQAAADGQVTTGELLHFLKQVERG